MDAEPAVEIKALRPDLEPDFMAFFDREAFADNPHWASCYCYFHHAPHDREAWTTRTGEQNRRDVSRWIQDGEMTGYIAYVDGRTAGWCNATLPAQVTTRQEGKDQPPGTGLVVCFVIAPPFRGKGIARRLLDAACRGFQERGMTSVVGFPRRAAEGAAENYHGPLSLYLQAGFEIVDEAEGVLTVRKTLEAG